MLTLHTGSATRDCAGISRRNFLRAGSLAIGGLTLPWLLEARARAAAVDPAWVKDRAVVLVFLAGGASHIETFNPNMDGPEQSRSVTGEVKTSLPGVTFGGTFPLLAKHAKHAVIVRSFRHPVGNHEQAISHVLTGGTDPNGPGEGRLQHGLGVRPPSRREPPEDRHCRPTHCSPTRTRTRSTTSEMQPRRGRLAVGAAGRRPSRRSCPTGKGPALENMS